MGFIVGHARIAFGAELAVERFRRFARGFGFGSRVLKTALILMLAEAIVMFKSGNNVLEAWLRVCTVQFLDWRKSEAPNAI